MQTIKKIFLVSFILMISFIHQSKGCTYKVELYDYYGNGWYNGSMSVLVGTDTVLKNITMAGWSYGPTTFTFEVNTIDSIRVVYKAGNWPNSNYYKMYNSRDELIYTGGSLDGTYPPKTETIGITTSCPSHDLKLLSIVSPKFGCGLNSSVPVSVSIKNYGATSESNFNVSYTVNNGLTWITELVNSNIAAGGIVEYTFTQQANMAAIKQYKIKAAVDLNTDTYSSNDSSSVVDVNHSDLIAAFPYNQDFESGATGWNSGGINSSWQLGMPSKGDNITSVPSGTYAWVTGLTNQYNANEHSYVESPCFDFSSMINPVIEFKHIRFLDWNDGVALMYSTDGITWNTVPSATGSQQWTNNWLNLFTNSGYTSSSCWSGSNWQWVTSTTCMPVLAGKSNVKFRFVFLSNATTQNDGFAFDDFKIYQPDKMSFVSLSAYHPDTAFIKANQKDVNILKLELTTVSSTTPIKAKNFKLKTTGTTSLSDIKNVRLVTTGTQNYLYSWNQTPIGISINPSNSTLVFNDSITLAEGINYFWLLYDIDSIAPDFNVVDAVCDSVVVADTARAPSIVNYAGNKLIISPMLGTYTIALTGTPDFNSFTEAVSALSGRGISGPVIFNVAAGTYTEQFLLPEIVGSSPINTVIFQAADGDSSSVILTYNATNYNYNYIIGLNGIDNCVFRKITFKPTGVSYASAINYKSYNCDNIEISNCVFQGNDNTSSNTYKTLIWSDYSSNNNVIIRNNSFINGSYAVYFYYSSNVIIENNTFQDQYYGIELYNCQKSVINKNILISSRTSSYYGIYLSNSYDSLQITNNYILSQNSSSGYGIYLYYANAYQPTAKRVLIANNMITLNKAYGIYVYYSANVDVVNNSVLIKGNNSNSSALYITNCLSGINVINNNFVNSALGYALYYDNTYTKSNYNNLYSTSSSVAYNSSTGIAYSKLLNYQVASNLDSNSISVDPKFISNEDLRTYSFDLNAAAIPFSLVNTDIEGDIRNATLPDIGADEFDVASNEAALVEVKSPLSGCGLGNESIKIKIKNRGGSAINGNLIAYYQFAGGPLVSQNVTGNINSNDTTIFTFTTKTNLTVLNNDSVYKLKCWIGLIGDTVHSNDTLQTFVYSGYTPYAPLVVSDTVNFGENAVLKAKPVDENYKVYWYNSPSSKIALSYDTVYTTPRLSQTQTYYAQTGGTISYNVNSLLTSNTQQIYTYNSTYGYTGGIAVTKDYVYVVGSSYTGRYNASDLSSAMSYTVRKGIFSDLNSGKLYTLWNGTSDPSGSYPYTVTAIRGLNADVSLGTEIINLSTPITLNNGTYKPGIYVGSGYVLLEDGASKNVYKVDIKTGVVTVLANKAHSNKYSYNGWVSWGVTEYDGTNYSILYRTSSGNSIVRFNLNTGLETTVNSFSNLGTVESFTISPWTNRWYLSSYYSNQFSTNYYNLSSADVSLTGVNSQCGSAMVAVKATVINTPPKIAFNNDTLLFNNVMQYTSVTDTLDIHNTGGDTLKIFSETSGNPAFTVNTSAFNLVFSDEIGKIPVTITPQTKGLNSTKLTISNNDRDTVITLYANVFGAPTYTTNMDSIVVNSTVCHDTIKIPLEIRNAGDTSLTYTIKTKKYSNGSSGKILLIGQDDRFESVLSANNYTVTKITYSSNYNGTNPSLSGYSAVIISDGYNYGYEMPVNGQNAIVDFVKNGGGLLATDRTSYEIYYNRFAQLASILPLRSTSTSSYNQTLTKIVSHPVTLGLPASFALAYCGYSNTTLNSGTTLISGTSSPAAVAIKEIGMGKVVQYGFTGKYSSYDPFADANLQTLFLNSINWITNNNWITVNSANSSVLKNDTNTVIVSLSNQGLVTGNYTTNIIVNTNDPKHVVDTISVKMNFNGYPDVNILEKSIAFKPIFKFDKTTKTLHLVNKGCDILTIDSVTFSSNQFTKLSSSTNVNPGDTGTIVMQFNPNIKGDISDILYVYTNDIDTLIQLSALALGPPSLNFVKDTIHASITSCNDSLDVSLKVFNNGDTSLVVSFSGIKNTTSKIKVLVLGADATNYIADVKAKLESTNLFKSVTVKDVMNTTPTLAELKLYDAVFVWMDYWNGYYYYNATTFGNVLADYIDAGGSVVTAVFENSSGSHLYGRWDTEKYYGIARTSYTYGYNRTLGTKLIPSHPILNNVNSFNGGYYSFRPNTSTLTTGSTLVANWDDGKPLIVEKKIKGHTVIDLGMFPLSSTVYYDSWDASTDGAKIMANSLQYAFDKNNESISMSVVTDTILKGDTLSIPIRFNSSNIVTGTYQKNIFVSSNDPLHPVDTAVAVFKFNGTPIAAVSKNSISIATKYKYSVTNDSLYYKNIGCDTLFLDSTSSTSSDLKVVSSKTYILPNDSAKISITFSPLSAKVYTEQITFNSKAGNKQVSFGATVLNPPIFTHAPDTISALITSCNDTLSVPITIKNTGDQPLIYVQSNTYTSIYIPVDTLLPNESAKYNVKFDASNLISGNYYSNFKINSNDPVHLTNTIVTNLKVTGYPVISSSDSIVKFDSVMQFTSLQKEITLSNSGCDTLFINNIKSTNADFTVDSTKFYVLKDNSHTLKITFAPQLVKSYKDTLTLITNDKQVKIAVNGVGTAPPIIKLNKDSIYQEISSCNDTLIIPIKIWNEGTPRLMFSTLYTKSTIKPALCKPITTGTCCGMGITQFTLNTINSITDDGSEGYKDYTSTSSTVLESGKSYPVYVKTSASEPENVKVWIDLNNNAVFESNEEVYASNGAYQDHSGTIAIPLTAEKNVPLRLRVGSEYYYQGIVEPCTNTVYGQFEDYTVVIQSNYKDTIVSGDTSYINLSFEANKLVTGINADTLFIASNDPLKPVVKIPYKIKVQPIPSKPNVSSKSICFGQAIPMLKATGTNIKWYSDNAGKDTLIKASDSLQLIVSSVGTYKLHVTQSDVYGCESKDSVISLLINAIPSQPAVADNSSCNGDSINNTLKAIATNGIKWYANANLSTLLDTNVIFHTKNKTAGTYTYYVTQTVNGCAGQSDTVTLKVNVLPNMPVALDTFACYNTTVPRLTANGDSLVWYSNKYETSGPEFDTKKTAIGTYNYNVFNVDKVTKCMSIPDTSTLVIHYTPPPTATSEEVCYGQATPVLLATGTNIRWYNDVNLNNLNTANDTLNTHETNVNIYTYYATQSDNSYNCESPAYTATLSIKDLPTKPVGGDKQVCYGSAVPNLTSTGNGIIWFTNANLLPASQVHTGSSYATGKTAVGIYNYYIIKSDGVCNSILDTVTLSIDSIPLAPVATDVEVCYGSPLTDLTAIGTTVKWYSDSKLDSLKYIGNTYSTNKTQAGIYTYYATQTYSTNNCISMAKEVVLTIDTVPTAPVAVNKTVCEGSIIPDLIATGSGIKWYGDSLVQNLIHTGDTLSTGKTAAGFYTFYAVQTTACGNSKALAVTLNINSKPTIPTASDTTVCYGSVIPPLKAIGSNVKWYAASNLSSSVYSGNNYATGKINTGTYTYYLTQTIGACTSNADSVTLIIQSLPNAPTGTDKTICVGDTVPKLNAIGSSIKWYSDVNLITKVDTGSALNTGKTSSGVYVYYATQTSQLTGCQSNPKIIRLTINDIPLAPTALDAQACTSSGSITLSANGTNIKWYSDSTLSTFITSGLTYTASVQDTGNFVYYITQTVSSCTSKFDIVQLVVKSSPVAPVALDKSVCEGLTVPALVATGSSIKWYNKPLSAFIPVGFTDTLNTGKTLAGVYTYYATQTSINGCESVKDTVTLTIQPKPATPVVADATMCYGATVPTFSTSGYRIKWYADSKLDTLVHTGNTYTPAVSSVGMYDFYSTNTDTILGCISAVAKAKLAVHSMPVIDSVNYANETVCNKGDGQIHIFASSDTTINYSIDGGISFVKQDTFNTLKHGNYPIVISTVYGCKVIGTTISISSTNAPAAPSVTNAEMCYGSTIPALSAVGNSITWYNDALLQDSIGSGNTFIPIALNKGVNNFYVTSTNVAGCESKSATATLTAWFIDAPVAVSKVTRVNATIPSLTAVGSSVTWYKDITLDTIAFIGNTFATGKIAIGKYTYYVTNSDVVHGCESPATKVSLSIYDSLPKLTTTNATICQGTVVPALTATGYNPKWYQDAALTILLDSGNTYKSTITTPGTYTFYVTQTDTILHTQTAAINSILTIHAIPLKPAISDVIKCNGDAVLLSNTSVNTHWYDENNMLLDSGTTYSPNVVSIGTYIFLASEIQNKCESLKDTILVTLKGGPAIDSVSKTLATACQLKDASLTIHANSIYMLQYSIDGGLTYQSSNTFNSLGVGNYPIAVKEVGLCTTKGDTVIILSKNTPSVPVVNDTAVCFGLANPALIANGANLNWYSDIALTDSIATGLQYIPTVTSAGMYSYFVTQKLGACVSPATKATFIIYALPALPVVVTPALHCANDAINLTATGSNLQWYSDSVVTKINALVGKLAVGTYSYFVTQTNNFACTSKAQKLVVNNYIPTTPVALDKQVCEGSSIPALTASGTNLKWYSEATLLTLESSALSFDTKKSAAGIYTYYVTNNDLSGCSSKADTISLIIKSTPAKPVLADITKCSSDTVILSNNQITYWYDKNNSVLDSTHTYKLPKLTNGTYVYYASLKLNSCESIKDTVTISIKSGPSIDSIVSANASDCSLSDAIITVYSSASGTIQYSHNGGLSFGSANSFNGLAIGNYPIVIKESGKCSTYGDTVIITSKNAPLIPVVTNASVCFGAENPALTAVGTNLNWYSTIELLGGIANGESYIPNVTAVGTYTYFVTQRVGNCSSPGAKATFIINPSPASPLVTDVTNCASNALMLSASGTKTIKWYSDSTITTAVQTGNTYLMGIIDEGTYNYYVTQTDAVTTCASAKQKITGINYLPAIPIAPDKSVCYGSVVPKLTATGTSINWYTDATLTNLLLTGNTFDTKRTKVGKDSYYVTQTDAKNCSSKAKLVTLTVNPNPLVTLNSYNEQLVKGKSFIIKAYNAATYIWSPVVTLSNSNGATVTATPATSTTYTVIGTNDQGCTNTASIAITVVTDINDDIQDNSISIYPNPTSGCFNITLNFNKEIDVVVNLYNETGQLVDSRIINRTNNIHELYNISHLSQGIYNIRIISTDNTWQINKRILLQK